MVKLNDRELASVILLTVSAIAIVLTSKNRPELQNAMAGLVRSFVVWKIQLPFLLYLAYTFLVITIAASIGLWKPELLKETLLVVCTVGIPMLFSANKITQGSKLVRDAVRAAVGGAAIMGGYVNLAPLPLLGELLLQPFVFILSAVVVISRKNADQWRLQKLTQWLLTIVGVGLLTYSTSVIVSIWSMEIFRSEAEKFGVSVWLPIALIPFIYVFSFIMHSEVILITLPFLNNGRKPPLSVQVACLLGLRFSTKLASGLAGPWRGQIARAAGFKDAWAVMGDFRNASRERDRALLDHDKRMRLLSGVDGVDQNGLRLDRREFAATKRVLKELYFLEMGSYRQRGGGYRPELLDLAIQDAHGEEPVVAGIQIEVRKDGRAWRAWRRTISGWYFGIGGAANVDYQWQYDGPTPPDRFPSEGIRGWVNVTVASQSAEWAKNDEAPSTIRHPLVGVGEEADGKSLQTADRF
jgi:hypothetical protein